MTVDGPGDEKIQPQGLKDYDCISEFLKFLLSHSVRRNRS